MSVTPSALSGTELTTLSHFELGQILNDIDAQHGSFSRVAANAERALGDAEARLIEFPDDITTRVMARKLRGQLNAAKIQISALNKRQSRVQSVLRSLGPVPN